MDQNKILEKNGMREDIGKIDIFSGRRSNSYYLPKLNNKYFAQTIIGSKAKICDIPTNQLCRPCVKGEELPISISENGYVACYCQVVTLLFHDR